MLLPQAGAGGRNASPGDRRRAHPGRGARPPGRLRHPHRRAGHQRSLARAGNGDHPRGGAGARASPAGTAERGRVPPEPGGQGAHDPDGARAAFRARPWAGARRPHRRAAAGDPPGVAGLIGAVLVDKPEGITSHDVVQRVRRALGIRSAGHTGTLDPFATGLLVVLLGRATRLARFVESQAKTYLATAHLGAATTTDDLEGESLDPVLDTAAVAAAVDRARLEAALAGFLGAQRQRPPSFSAKRVGGE